MLQCDSLEFSPFKINLWPISFDNMMFVACLFSLWQRRWYNTALHYTLLSDRRDFSGSFVGRGNEKIDLGQNTFSNIVILAGWIHELMVVRGSFSLALPRSLGLSEQSLDRKGSGKMERENERVEASSLSAVSSPLFRRIGRDESSAWGMRKRERAYLLWTGRGLLHMAPLLQVQFHRVMWLPRNLGSQRCLEKVIALFQLCTARDPYCVLPWSCENGSQPLPRSITILPPLPATINPVWGRLHGWWHGQLKHCLPTSLQGWLHPPIQVKFHPHEPAFLGTGLIHFLPCFLHWVTCASIFYIYIYILICLCICHGVSTPYPGHSLYTLPRAYQLWKQEPCLAPWRSNVPHRLWYLNACSPIDGTVWRELIGVSL